jgi:hypothetical protein
VLSPVIGLFCHRRLADSRDLNASVEASGPHDFAVRLSAIRQRRIRVHRIPPRVRDDRDTPLLWDETPTDIQLIWVRAKTIFRKFRNIFVAPSPDSFPHPSRAISPEAAVLCCAAIPRCSLTRSCRLRIGRYPASCHRSGRAKRSISVASWICQS